MPAGLRTLESHHDPVETMARLASAVAAHGMDIMARIDHAAAAAAVGLVMQPAVVLTFGNPRAGTGLMQAVPTLGIDLPLRALVWQDAAGMTWLSYNDPAWLAGRHGVVAGASQTIRAMADALATVARQATEPNA